MCGFIDLNYELYLNDFVILPFVSITRLNDLSFIFIFVFIFLFVFFYVISKNDAGTVFFNYILLAIVEYFAIDFSYCHY